MTTARLTYRDGRIRDAILQQLAWDSEVEADDIAVTASRGAVTLTGFVDSYAGKLAAERAAKRVRGVRAVANDVQVRLRLDRTDADIAADAAHALFMRVTLPESVQAVVHAGHVTLTGAVSTLFQRETAATAVRPIRGVKGIVNRITVKPRPAAGDVRGPIVRALRSNADVDATLSTSASPEAWSR
jgi:osmotically-inducible protein OsmY